MLFHVSRMTKRKYTLLKSVMLLSLGVEKLPFELFVFCPEGLELFPQLLALALEGLGVGRAHLKLVVVLAKLGDVVASPVKKVSKHSSQMNLNWAPP